MPEHIGARRRTSPPSVGAFVAAGVAVVAVVVLAVVLLVSRHRPDASGTTSGPPALTWTGPAPKTFAGRLADGTAYQPRLFVTASDSVGIAPTPDGSAWRVLARVGGQVTELRRVAASEAPQFDGFAASADTVVWAESAAKAGADVRTTLYRSNWRTGAKATAITANTGDPSFFGGGYDLVVRDGKVYWAAAGAGGTTEIRSVALIGGTVATTRLTGTFGLSAAPWAVTASAAPGKPVELVNLSTNQKVTVSVGPAEAATCGPVWCRIAVLGGGGDLVRLDVAHPDGSQRRRMAGPEATPTVDQVALVDRFVPLKTDVPGTGAGLSLYDTDTVRTSLVALGVANVRAAGAMLWWSTGAGDSVAWSALDLSAAV